MAGKEKFFGVVRGEVRTDSGLTSASGYSTTHPAIWRSLTAIRRAVAPSKQPAVERYTDIVYRKAQDVAKPLFTLHGITSMASFKFEDFKAVAFPAPVASARHLPRMCKIALGRSCKSPGLALNTSATIQVTHSELHRSELASAISTSLSRD